MKKHLSLILGILFFSLGCFAQNTTVTATVTDGDSVVWANATWTIDFVPGIQFPAPSQYTINGAALSSAVTHQTGTLSSSGALSVVVYDSSIVTPTASGWRLNICPLTSGSCITYQFSTAGGSQSISANLTSTIGQPRFPCNTVCRGYNTFQAIPITGAIFFNTTPGVLATCKQYNGTVWNYCQYPTLVASAVGLAQNANISATTAYTVPATEQGQYLVSCYIVTTQTATTSGTLPGCNVQFTDAEGGTTGTGTNQIIATNTGCATILSCNTTNVTANNIGTVQINAKASTNIQYATTGYTSVGAQALQYAIHFKVFYLGPS